MRIVRNACRSKKHLERADALRAAMQEEEDALSPIAESDAENDVSSAGGDPPDDLAPPTSEEEDIPRASGRPSTDREASPKAPLNGLDTGQQHSTDGYGSLDQILADLDAGAQTASQERSSSEEAETTGSEDASEVESEASEESLDEDAMLARMVQAHARVSKPRPSTRRQTHARDSADTDHREAESTPPEPVSNSTEAADDGAEDLASPPAAEPSDGASSAAQPESIEAAAESTAEQPPEDDRSSRKPKSKKDKRKAKEAAAAQNGLICAVCRAQFETRNQLFKHIADRGHAQLK